MSAPVRGTGMSAAQAKVSAVNKGYYKDDFQALFLQPGPPRRAQPIINRGYYARVHAFDSCVLRFLKQFESKCQVVSLGAGIDSTFFRLQAQGTACKLFVDVDMPQTCEHKAQVVRCNENLTTLTKGETKPHADCIHYHSENYRIISADLRNLDQFRAALTQAGISFTEPTLFLCECFLVYLEPESANQMLASIGETFSVCGVLAYDPTSLNDSFGRVMMTNFENQGMPLLGMQTYTTHQQQEERMASVGFPHTFVLSMLDYYEQFLPDRQRIERLEWFDELEEWRIMMSHYSLYGAATNEIVLQAIKPSK